MATIVPANETVHGLLWDITPVHEAGLDRYEGVSRGFYSKHRVDVLVPDGAAVEALVYVATNAEPGPPRCGYLGRIIEAARAHGLPAGYVTELEEWQNWHADGQAATL